jgi:phosphoglycerol transferase MdoB-like AlkP superfamily enzyme
MNDDKYIRLPNKILQTGMLWMLLAIKPFIFYSLMEIENGFLLIWALTSIMLVFLFESFPNRYVPFVIYGSISLLMFADITFHTYFNGYLSTAMIQSSKYLGDVGDVIVEVIQPSFFLLLADLPLVGYIVRRRESKTKNLRRIYGIALSLLLLLVMAGSFTNVRVFRSAGNIEFFSYHVKDVLTQLAGPLKTSAAENWEFKTEPYRADPANPYFGIAKGKNLIVVQLEAVQNFVVGKEYEGQEITPVMNRLIQEPGTLYFDNYYMQISAGNTADAEFATNNSLYGTIRSYTNEIYKENTFRGLPVLLNEKGYRTIAMHGYDGSFWSRDEMYPSQGFDIFADERAYHPTRLHGWGILDEEFYRQSVKKLAGIKEPFYGFLISLSNHTPFEMDDDLRTLQLLDRHQSTRFGNYLDSVAYSDHAIGVLIEELKKNGLYEDSVLVFYGDHFGLAEKDADNEELMTEFLGKPYRFDEMAKVPLLIHIPGSNLGGTRSIAGGQIDFLPTISFLLGFDSLDTVYLGQNLLTAKKGFVAQNRYAPAGSVITDHGIYFMSIDGIFENGKAWSLSSGKELPVEGFREQSKRAAEVIERSETYLRDDVLRSDIAD